jgi:hypothetical protein
MVDEIQSVVKNVGGLQILENNLNSLILNKHD